MTRNTIVVGACLTLLLSSCGRPSSSDFSGGGGERKLEPEPGLIISQWQQAGEQFYVGVWHKDSNEPAFLLLARVPVTTHKWGLTYTSDYKYKLFDHAQEKTWVTYDVDPESSQESLVIAEQSYDLKNGRIFLLNITKAEDNVVQIDANLPDQGFGDILLPGAFANLAEEHQKVRDFFETNR